VWTSRISVSRRAWTGRGMDGSLWIDVNGAPRAVGRDQYTVPTGYGTTSVARRLHSRSHAAHGLGSMRIVQLRKLARAQGRRP